MAKDRKIDANAPDLLVRYHETVTTAARLAVTQALLRHKLHGTPIALSKDGEAVVLSAKDVRNDSLSKIWDNEEDDVYAELLEK